MNGSDFNISSLLGKKVVCVNDTFSGAVFEVFDAVPRKGGIYTVNHVAWGREWGTNRRVLGVRLAELPPIQPGAGQFSFWRFRLLEEETPALAALHDEFALGA